MEIGVKGVCDGLPVVGAVYCGGFGGLAVEYGKMVAWKVGGVLEVVGVFDLFELGVVILGVCEGGGE